MNPYESDLSRVRAMYRIPGRPARNRALELCYGAPPILDGMSRQGDGATVAWLSGASACVATEEAHRALGMSCVVDYRGPLPFAAGSFDMVIVHGTLDRLVGVAPELRNRRFLIDFVGRIRDVLVAGGLLAGCVANRTSFERLWPVSGRRSSANRAMSPALLTIGSCQTVLSRAGFHDLQLFNVRPGADSPLRLINTDATLSKEGFRRELEAVRPALSVWSYAARRALLALALNRFVEDSIFFWAYRR